MVRPISALGYTCQVMLIKTSQYIFTPLIANRPFVTARVSAIAYPVHVPLFLRRIERHHVQVNFFIVLF